MIDRPLQPAVLGGITASSPIGDAAVASATEQADADDASAGRNRRCRAPRRGRRRRHPGIRRLPGPRRAAPYSPAASLAASPPAPPPRTSRPTPPPPAPRRPLSLRRSTSRAPPTAGSTAACSLGRPEITPGQAIEVTRWRPGVGRAHAAARPLPRHRACGSAHGGSAVKLTG